MSQIQLILFDLDDTLLDFNACWDRGMQEALRVHPYTCDLDPDTLFQKMKHYSEALWYLYEEKHVTFAEYRRIRFAKTLGEFGRETTDELADDFQRLFSQKNLESMGPTSSLIALMTELSGTYKLGIITNGPLDLSYKKVERLGLSTLFPSDNIFVSEEVGHHKPEPEIYQLALDHFGVTADQALFVGDSWLHDVAGPIAIGMRAIWLDWKGQQPSTDHQPLAVIKDLGELKAVLEASSVTV